MFTGIESYLIIWSVAMLVAYVMFIVFKKLYLFTDYLDAYGDFQPYINDGVHTYEAYSFSNKDSYGLSGLTATNYTELSSEIFVEEIADEEDSSEELPIYTVPVIEEPTDDECSNDGANDCGMASHVIQQGGEVEDLNYCDDFEDDIGVRQSVNVKDFSRSDETAKDRTVNDCSTMSDDIQHVHKSVEVNCDEEFSDDISEGQSTNCEELSPSDETTTDRTVNVCDDCGKMSDDAQHVDKIGERHNNDKFSNDTLNARQPVDESGQGSINSKLSTNISKGQSVNVDDISTCDETSPSKAINECSDYGTKPASIQCADENMNGNNGLDNHVRDTKDFLRSDETAADQAANACNDCNIAPDPFQRTDAVGVRQNGEFRFGISDELNTDVEDLLKTDETLVGNIADAYGGSNSASKKPVTKIKRRRFNKSFRKLFCVRCVKGVKD